LGGIVQKPPSSHLVNEYIAVRGYLVIAVAVAAVIVVVIAVAAVVIVVILGSVPLL
jgi:hypothetical protein